MSAIKYQQVAINCDNPQCGYTEEVTDRNLLKNYINKPCPKCGQVMYTKEDFEKHEEILNIVDALNGILSQEEVLEDTPQEEVHISVHFKDGEVNNIEIKNGDARQGKSEQNRKPIPNGKIIQGKKNDETQRKVNFYLAVQKIEPQVAMDDKIDWLIATQEILKINSLHQK